MHNFIPQTYNFPTIIRETENYESITYGQNI